MKNLMENLKKFAVDEIKNDIKMYACGEQSTILETVYENNLMLYDKLLVQYHWYDKAFNDIGHNSYEPLTDAEDKQIDRYAQQTAEEVKFLIDNYFKNWYKEGKNNINVREQNNKAISEAKQLNTKTRKPSQMPDKTVTTGKTNELTR